MNHNDRKRNNHRNDNTNSLERKTQKLKEDLRKLKEEIRHLNDDIINTDDIEYENLLRDSLKAKEKILEGIQNEIDRNKTTIRQEKLTQMKKIRGQHRDKRKYEIAELDAKEFVFYALCSTGPEIANYFSNSNRIIEYKEGTTVFPDKLSHKWYHDVSRTSNNIIPLSPGIEVPQRMVKNELRDVQFFFSNLYKDKKLIEDCKNYYKNRFSLDFTIEEDKGKYKKFWMQIKVGDQGVITFNKQ